MNLKFLKSNHWLCQTGIENTASFLYHLYFKGTTGCNFQNSIIVNKYFPMIQEEY